MDRPFGPNWLNGLSKNIMVKMNGQIILSMKSHAFIFTNIIREEFKPKIIFILYVMKCIRFFSNILMLMPILPLQPHTIMFLLE